MNYTEFTDDELVRFAQQRNAPAFDELTNRYLKRIFTAAFGIIKNTQDAEDATQEIFTLAWTRIGLFGFKAKFATWLYRLTHNYCIDIVRAKKRKPKTMTLPPPDEVKNGKAETPVERVLAKEEKENVKEILGKLTERQRQILMLYYEDETLKNIAATVKCSLATVKRELKKITLFLEKHHEKEND